jgi:hypothetical protein
MLRSIAADILHIMVAATLTVLAEESVRQPIDPPNMVVIGAGLLALIISLVVWPIAQYSIIIVHEGGHALAVSAMGGRVTGVRVGRRRDGETRSTGLGPFGAFVTALAGYLGPSAFGLVGAVILHDGHVKLVLWLSVILLLLAMVQMHNPFGVLATGLTGGVIVLFLAYADPSKQLFFTYTWIWFLLIGGFGGVLTLQRARAGGDDNSSDAFALRKLTYLPASLWSGMFWLTTLTVLIYGAGILLDLLQWTDLIHFLAGHVRL